MSCKGLWFRISKEYYTTQRGASLRIQMRFLKKDSCPGCEECNRIRQVHSCLGSKAINNLHLKSHGQKCRLKIIKKG